MECGRRFVLAICNYYLLYINIKQNSHSQKKSIDLENFEAMFPLYNMLSNFKSSATIYCLTCSKKVNHNRGVLGFTLATAFTLVL